jgi:hypothetical protein
MTWVPWNRWVPDPKPYKTGGFVPVPNEDQLFVDRMRWIAQNYNREMTGKLIDEAFKGLGRLVDLAQKGVNNEQGNDGRRVR